MLTRPRFGVRISLAAIALLALVFGVWALVLSQSVRTLRTESDADLRLTGQLGQIERVIHEMDAAVASRRLGLPEAGGSPQPLRARLANFSVLLQNDPRSQRVIGAQLPGIGTALNDVDAAFAADLAAPVSADRSPLERQFTIASLRAIDVVGAASRAVRAELSSLSTTLARKWAQLEVAAAGAAVLALALCAVLIAYDRALREVKQLRRLVPVCSTCKRVRDDHDSWQQMEEYVSAHSGAAFSRSVCPKCYEAMGGTPKPAPDD